MDTKRLELLLLAGCSCLITLLAQPIAGALASPTQASSLQAPMPTIGAYCRIDQSRLQKLAESEISNQS